MKRIKKIIKKLLNLIEEKIAQAERKKADILEQQRRANIDCFDRSVIRKQLCVVFEKLPSWQNIFGTSVFLEEVDATGFYIYKVAKKDIQKHLSTSIGNEILETLNQHLKQLHFEAYESVNYAYEEAVYDIRSALAVASARADWNSPNVQADFEAKRANAQSSYMLTFKNHAYKLFLLQVIAIEDNNNYLILSVKIVDMTQYYRWQPQALSFS